ncbi:Kinesin motor domain family protein [Leishmania donovani]|uniref:Kinesin motor domain family protein n=2 Tax=Leishmania donovani TaxID=5661 RepID=A0A504XD01_LEIDO|nr:Kinesin motor domain family protein [Leishmania donovani]
MATESSSVLVAVRVRPFTPKEDSAFCTITIPDSTTISVLDLPALIPSSTASGLVAGGVSSSANGSDGGVLTASMALGSANSSGGVLVGGKSVHFNSSGSLEALQHSYSFDKIFWSVSPAVLPFPPPSVLDALAGDDDAVGGPGSGGGRGIKVPGLAHPTKAQRSLLTQCSAIARNLPCFAQAPTYDDQQSVYEFIGPRMYEAVMSGFNACLFAYGQTGSGKSYSMIGPTDALSGATGASASSSGNSGHSPPPAQRDILTVEMPAEHGIMPRLCSDLFRLMREEREKDEGVTYSVELSFLEIYCEKVHDLIAAASSLTAANSNSTYVGTSASASASLRIRQHPSRGPYVEGLSHVKVRDAGSVIKYLLSGLRERATAETKMNEHSSRSHAILQLHITKVLADTDESTGGVITRTRMCKVNMVDLAGSERVSQSGVSGDRLEEAKNINLSLSTLGRVIQQLSEKQAGKNVIPAYRDSVLTWLLSDSLGGNSKTIMLATVAPSAYCYQQTLNTLRFAGVAKKIVNVATVNEDRHFQELISELRRQIVRLTLQLESGKAAEVHLEKIDALKREREALLTENDALKLKVVSTTDTAVLQALRKRVKDLEAENAQLGEELQGLQERMLISTGALRDELAQQRAEAMQLYEKLMKREAEVTGWANRYRALVISTTTPSTVAASAAGGIVAGGAKAAAATADAKEALRAQQQLQEELKQTRAQLQKATQDLSAAERATQEALDATRLTSTQLDEYRVRYEESKRQLDLLHERMQSTVSLLETTQCELSAVKSHSMTEFAKTRPAEDALEVTNTTNVTAAAQLEQMRNGYLEEKQRNVQLLLRVAQVEQERSALKRAVTQRAAEMCELEQLLLEETETSERYYTRMRFHRSEHELQHQWMVQLLRLRSMADRRSADGMRWSAAGAMGAFPSHHPTLRPGEGEGSRGTPEVPSQRLYRDPNSANAPPTSAAHEAVTSEQLLHMQLAYECQCEELQARAAVEQECAAELTSLLSQKARLRQIAAAELSEKLADAEGLRKTLREELHYYKQKVETQEKEYAEEVAQHQSDSNALQSAEMERMRLERKVGALEEASAELEAGRNLLIAKVAQLQDQQSMWQARCAEAERISAEVQDLLFPGSYGTSSSSPANRTGEGDGDSEDQLPKRRSCSALQLEAATLTSKVRDAQDAMEAKAALERQCEEYRGELGALRAQVEQMKSQTQAAQQQRARSDRAHQQVQTRFSEANAQLLQEISTITRDYESRIKQQQEMMNTLRHALDEETSMADMCRQSAQRAEAARQAQEEELLAAREAAEELRRERETTTKLYLEVQAELNELRTHYHALERQLMELREREPELYVLLEKGLDEDTTSWLEKVRGEKLRLQNQRHEARRLNSELLEHVQDSNTRLRDVQKRLADVSIGGDELEGDKEIPGNQQCPPHTLADVDTAELEGTLCGATDACRR